MNGFGTGLTGQFSSSSGALRLSILVKAHASWNLKLAWLRSCALGASYLSSNKRGQKKAPQSSI